LLAVADTVGYITIRKLTFNYSGRIGVANPLWDQKPASPAHQVLFSVDGKRFLVYSHDVIEVGGPEAGMLLGSQTIAVTKGASKWANDPSQQRKLILVSGDRLGMFDWGNFSELSGQGGKAFKEQQILRLLMSSSHHEHKTSASRALPPELLAAMPQFYAYGPTMSPL